MRLRLFVVLAVVAAALIAVAPGRSSAATAPRCQGVQATDWLTSPGTLEFTAGNDVLVGSTGADTISGGVDGGVDLVCGGKGNDEITIKGAGSHAEGGPGADDIDAYDGASANGGSGDDLMHAFGEGSIVHGSSGSDSLFAEDGATASGESGNDEIRGYQANKLLGGSGKDRIADDFESLLIDCGSGIDRFEANGTGAVVHCENEVFICGCLVAPNLDLLVARLNDLA